MATWKEREAPESVSTDIFACNSSSSSTGPSGYLSNMFSFQEQASVDGTEARAEDESVYRRISTFFSPLEEADVNRRQAADEARRAAAEAKIKEEPLS